MGFFDRFRKPKPQPEAAQQSPPEVGEDVSLRRIFQETRQAQRLIVDFQASRVGWIDTGLSPQALGGRRVLISWQVKVAMPPGELREAFMARIDQMALRMVPDGHREADWKYYKVDEHDKEGLIEVAAGAELRLKSGQGYVFPRVPGRIEVRLPGAKPSNLGTVRTAYLMLRVAPDDIVMVKSSVDDWQTYDLDLKKFPDPPELPIPE